MSMRIKIIILNVVISVLLGLWWARRNILIRRVRIEQIHHRLDDLDPTIRALSPEEEDERRGLMRELEEWS